MTTSGSRNGRVRGLAVWLPGTQFWFVPGLVFAPELGGLLVVTPCPLLELDCPKARALKPFFAMSMPPEVSKPILKRSRRLVRPAAMSSRRFLAALHISLKRRRETFSPKTL